MASTNILELSDDALQRARELADVSNMTPAEVIEQALWRFTPTMARSPHKLVRRGELLVITGGPRITAEQVQASIDEDREGIRDCS